LFTHSIVRLLTFRFGIICAVLDLEIALEEAKRMELKLPGLELALQLYNELKAQGHAKKGTHALILAFEKMNNVEIKPQ
jgi:3-hydroxyisobutyrate dehydrogenase